MELTKNTSVDPVKMLGKNYIEAVNAKFPNTILDEEWSTPNQVTLTVKTNMLPDVVEYLYYQHEGWLPLVFGNDERSIHGHYAVYYVLSMEGVVKTFVTIKALVDPVTLEFPSVTPKVKAAVWGERELFDMYGLKAVGLPDQRRLVLPDDWPDDLYPLRKDSMDYRLRPDPTTATETYEFINEKGEARIVPIGPLHITSDEPGHFRLFVDGEDIIDADYRLFYVHRGMEKLAETRMDYDQVNFLADRVCGICGFTHSVAYANSVENALGIQIPERAQWIRAILLEVERLHSHLLNLGLSSHFTGFDTGFMQFFRVREKSMTLAEVLTGARKTYGINLIGGVRRDMLKHQREQCIKLIAEMREELKTLVDILLNTPNMEQRTVGVGVLDRQVARDLVDNLPTGAIITEGFNYIPGRFALGITEAPRGEDIHWSMLGDNQKLYRWRCRAATYANWPTLRYMLRGNTVSDAPLIIGSLDPCYSCTDRVTVVDVRKRKAQTVSYKEIERYGIERKNSPLK